METTLKLPPLSGGAHNATIIRWHVAEGDSVKAGQVLASLETELGQMELEASQDGALRKILAPAGSTVEPDADLALLAAGPNGKASPADSKKTSKKSSSAKTASAPASGSADKVVPILMPKAGNDMVEGTLLNWKVAVGDAVKIGQSLFEIETDKATLEVEAEAAGTLRRIVVKAGQLCPVQEPVAFLAESDADMDAWLALHKKSVAAPSAPAPVAAAPAPSISTTQSASSTVTAPSGSVSSGRIAASPAARRMAAETGVNLGAVAPGSGPGGRILSGDVAARAPHAAPAVPHRHYAAPTLNAKDYAPAPKAAVTSEIKPLSGMRKAIARNLTLSKQTVPHFYMKLAIDAGRFLAFRQIQKQFCGASVNDVLVLAIARAMTRVPAFRCQWSDEGLVQFSGANIGIAVALPDGLRVPALVGVDQMTLAELVVASKEAVAAAREGKAHNPGKATFTISNLGMAGIEEFTAIVNPPESGILAVGGVVEAVGVEGGAIRAIQRLTMWLSADHRIVDGAVAAKFLEELKKILECPEALA